MPWKKLKGLAGQKVLAILKRSSSLTLVARLTVNGFPLLVGDILLSTSVPTNDSVVLPTVGDIQGIFPKGSSYTPSRLCQKITVIGDNLVIAWCGSAKNAFTVIKEMSDLSMKSTLSLDDVERYFQTVDPSVWDYDTGFVGFIKDARGIAQFGFHHMNFPTQIFGNVGLLGTGTGYVERFLRQFSSLPVPTERAINALERSLWFGLLLSGAFLSDEIATYQTLLNWFGAGYEIASLIEGKFQKLTDITFLFWFGEITASGVGMNLHQVTKYSYIDDLLLIRTATFSNFSANTPLTVNDRVYLVPPAHRYVVPGMENTLPRPSFDSKWLCSFFVTPMPAGRLGLFSRVDYSVQGEPPIRFVEEDNRMIVAFKKEKLEQTIKQAYETFPFK